MAISTLPYRHTHRPVMGSALSTFVGAIGSVKELMHVMAKMCDVLNKPPDHDSMGNGPKVGHNRDRLITEAQQQMGMDAVRDYNFIFCGPTKVGKSTLINAIRGVKPNDAGAAGVGSARSHKTFAVISTLGFHVSSCMMHQALVRGHTQLPPTS